jgi:hypothetical protein
MSSRIRLTALTLTFVTLGLLGAVGHRAQAQPPIGDTGNVTTGLRFDWTTGRWVVDTDRKILFGSALDPNRNVIDPGSFQLVDYQQYDANGVLWHYTGRRWTSFGVPHSEISRARSYPIAGGLVTGNQTQTQYRSPGGPGAGRNARPTLPQTDPRRSNPTRLRNQGSTYGNW